MISPIPRTLEIQAPTWPDLAGFTDEYSNMLRALFHLTSQVESCRQNQIGIGATDFDFAVESPHIYLRSRQSLLSDGHPLAQLCYFCLKLVNMLARRMFKRRTLVEKLAEESPIWQRILLH